MKKYWENETPTFLEERQQEHLRNHIIKYINIYHIYYAYNKKYPTGKIPKKDKEDLE
jgi:hypothetical protein